MKKEQIQVIQVIFYIQVNVTNKKLIADEKAQAKRHEELRWNNIHEILENFDSQHSW